MAQNFDTYVLTETESSLSTDSSSKRGCCSECFNRILKSKVSYLLKYILFFFNILLLVVGLVIVGLGVWQLVVKHVLTDDNVYTVDTVINVLASTCIIVGVIVVVLSSTACVGALRENVTLLQFFYWSVSVALVLEISATATVVVFHNMLRDLLDDILGEKLVQHYEDDEDAKTLLDTFQARAGCCGVTDQGYLDWNTNQYFNCSGTTVDNPWKCSVPYTCCKTQDSITRGVVNMFCGSGALKLQKTFAEAEIYTMGCVDRLVEIVKSNQVPVIVTFVVLVIIPQTLGIVLTNMLEKQILDQKASWESMRGVHQLPNRL